MASQPLSIVSSEPLPDNSGSSLSIVNSAPLSDPHSGFWHSLYDSTVGGALGTLKNAIGTEQLDDIAKRVNAGDYKGAALSLGQYVTKGPVGRLGDAAVQSSIDSGKALVQDLKDPSAGGKITSPTRAGANLTADAVGAIPLVGPIVSRPIKQAVAGDYAGSGGTVLGDALMLGTGKVGDIPVVGDAMEGAANMLRRQSLKGGFNVNTPSADVSQAIQTMRDQGIPMTPKGVAKISATLAELQKQKLDSVRQAAQSGATIDPNSVDARAAQAQQRAANQVNPKPDVKQTQTVRSNFMDANTQTTPAQPASTILGPNGQPLTPAVPATSKTVPIPLDKAEALKEGTYSKVYDPSPGKAATAKAEQALARGLKEEIETQVPEMGLLNAAQAKGINLQGILEKAVNKYTNGGGFLGNLIKSTLSPTSTALGAATGVLSHSPEWGASAAVLRAVLSDPAVQSQVARAIDIVRRGDTNYAGPTGMASAMMRVNDYRDSLSAPPPQPPPSLIIDPKASLPANNEVSVTAPDGSVHWFPNQQSADKFKELAGIK